MSLSQFIGWMAINPWLNFLITLTGLFLAVFFYIKGKKVKLPYYAVRSQNIVKDLVSRIDSLEMIYKGERIENLTATKIAFWNAGNETINGTDIIDLTVNVEGYKILYAKILDCVEKTNKFSISISDDKSYINICFDYLDKDQGVIIQLLHTGKSEQDIGINGKIKGFGVPINKYVPLRSVGLNRVTIGLFGMFSIIPAYIFFILATKEIPELKVGEIIVIVLFSLPSLLIGFLILTSILPKGFKKFDEEILI